MPPDLNVDYYLSDLRHGFAADMGSAQFRPGQVSGTGSLVFDDPEALNRLSDMLRAVMDGEVVPVTDGPTKDELRETYRV
jgi:hypothetical protein